MWKRVVIDASCGCQGSSCSSRSSGLYFFGGCYHHLIWDILRHLFTNTVRIASARASGLFFHVFFSVRVKYIYISINIIIWIYIYIYMHTLHVCILVVGLKRDVPWPRWSSVWRLQGCFDVIIVDSTDMGTTAGRTAMIVAFCCMSSWFSPEVPMHPMPSSHRGATICGARPSLKDAIWTQHGPCLIFPLKGCWLKMA